MGYLVHYQQEIGIFLVDYLLKPNCIIEYNGVPHYYINTKENTTTDKLKRKTLQAMGYKVAAIPFFEWHPLEM